MSLLSASVAFGPAKQRLDASEPTMAPLPDVPAATGEAALRAVSPPQGPPPWAPGSNRLPAEDGRSFRMLDQQTKNTVKRGNAERRRTPYQIESMPKPPSRISPEALRNIKPPQGPSPFSVSQYRLPSIPDGPRAADAGTRRLASMAFRATMGKTGGSNVSAIA